MAVGWTCQQSAQMNMRLANFMDIRSYKGVHQRLNKEVIATANRSRVSIRGRPSINFPRV